MSPASFSHSSRPVIRSAGLLVAACCLCFLAPCAAADDLTVLRAAVEQRLTSIRTLEVRYRWRQERTPIAPPELPTGDMNITWWRAEGREAFTLEPGPEGGLVPSRWAFDGRRTVAFSYSSSSPEQPVSVSIRPGPPRREQYATNRYPFYVGLRLWSAEGSLLDGIRSPSARLTWSGEQAGTRVPVIEFPARTAQNREITVRVTFDSITSGMPQHFQLIRDEDSWTTLKVEDVLAVPDVATGRTFLFPRRGVLEIRRGEQTLARNHFEADQVRLNEAIPDSRFELEIPFGVEVSEESARPGQPPRQYLAGGRAAMDAALGERIAAIQREVEQLATQGVPVDARPPGRYRWTRWLVVAGVVCLAAATVAIVRRRRQV